MTPPLFRRSAASLLLVLAVSVPASAQTITRGPYLQTGTSTSIVVRWRTNVATTSYVRYGTTQGQLVLQTSAGPSTTEHEVKLSGLQPATKYYYAVGTASANLAGNDVNHFFITAPLPGTAQPTRVWVIGDSGTADANAGHLGQSPRCGLPRLDGQRTRLLHDREGGVDHTASGAEKPPHHQVVSEPLLDPNE